MSGPFGSSPWGYNPGGDFYSYTIDQSLRFNDNDSAYLSRTPSSAGNRRTFTLSCWVKRGNLGINTSIFGAAGNYYNFRFNTTDTMTFYGNGTDLNFQTTRVFRDSLAWYHIVVAIDTTQSGGTGNRFKLYINGTQETSFISEVCAENAELAFNNTVVQTIGRRESTSSIYADLYLAEMHWIDGTALTPSSFGETKDGVWIPKAYSGSYGTNGFYLPFDDSSAIGDDESGNTNDWTVNNLVATDVVPDSPTNNFATYNVLNDTGQTVTYAEGNLAVTASSNWSTNVWRQGSIGVTGGAGGGKYYFEFVTTLQGSGQATGVGVQNSKATASTLYTEGVVYYNTVINANGSSVITGLTNNPASNVLRFAFDASNGKVWIGNSTGWYNSGDPANGTGEVGTIDNYDGSILVPITNRTSTSGTHTFNFGQDSSFAGLKTSGSANGSDDNGIGDFFYAVPNGFLSICSSNLQTPTIIDGTEHFNTVLWTGDAAQTRSLSGLGFQPDFSWLKIRSGTSQDHQLYDSVRGAGSGKNLSSNTTAVEGTVNSYPDGDYGFVSSFDADGFSVDDGAVATTGGYVNYSGRTYVAWNWKAGTTASGSEVGNNPAFSSSSNADAGFSIVSYTGTGSAGTVSHGCGAKPTMIIIKNRDQADNWAVYHAGTASDPETDYMILNLINAVADSPNWWNDTAPTDSVFTVGSDHSVNADGEDYIAYCFADVDGYSKASHYIGNNANNFVYTGFRPAFLMLKKTTRSTTYGWQMYDTSRSPINVALLPGMWADQSVVEAANTYPVNIHSNGFRLTGAGANQNASGVRYVYFAIADQPAKFSNAR